MATPNLDITEVAASQNNKEVTINNGLAQLDQATQGQQVHTAEGDLTINTTQFTNAFAHRIEGSPGAGFNVFVPARRRFFFVLNTTEQTATVAVTGTPGDTVEVPTGEGRLLYCDDTNIRAVGGGGGGGGGGAEAFTDLTDTFADYTGRALQLLRVKAAEDGLESVAVGDLLTVQGQNWSVPFRGAFAIFTENRTFSPPILLPWDDVLFDTDNFWSDVEPSKFVIPAGITKIRLHATIAVASNTWTTSSNVVVGFRKNGGLFQGSGVLGWRVGYNDVGLSCVSAPIPVVEGDEFEVRVNATAPSSIQFSSDQSAFVIEVVEVSDAIAREYDRSIYVGGQPGAGAKIAQIVLPRAVRLEAGAGQSIAYVDTAPTDSQSFVINKNGSAVGTIDFAATKNEGTFSVASEVEFAAGDRLELIAPSPQDATLADLSVTFNLVY